MKNKSKGFDSYVEKNILAKNEFGVTKINNLNSLKTIFFVYEEYPIIEKFIETGNIEAIKSFSEKQPRTGEYLDVMMFDDQNLNSYIVTVYDSNAIEQDPQVIKLYQMSG